MPYYIIMYQSTLYYVKLTIGLYSILILVYARLIICYFLYFSVFISVLVLLQQPIHQFYLIFAVKKRKEKRNKYTTQRQATFLTVWSKRHTLCCIKTHRCNCKMTKEKTTIPLKFLITNFFEAPLLLEATAEVLAIPLVLCSVRAEKLALLSCRVSSAIIRLALWLNAIWFKCFAKLLIDCSVACLFIYCQQQHTLFVEPVVFGGQ